MNFKKVSLVSMERTPLQFLPRLSRHLGGPRIYIKREDMNGCLGLAGNKIRKLEYLLAEALEQGCDTVITTGGLQSNHARATVAACRKLDLKPVLVLVGKAPEGFLSGNLLLGHLMGAEMVFTGSGDFSLLEAKVAETAEKLAARGHRPYVIPMGASNPLGTLGFVAAQRELGEQLREEAVAPTWQVATAGSGGTYAGILLGALLEQQANRVLGFSVLFPVEEISHKIKELALAASHLLKGNMAEEKIQKEIRIDSHYIGAGYGIPTEEGLKAIKLLAELEGILLDPTYTGKAMAGLLDYIQKGIIGPKDTVVFWHTGGQVGLFNRPLFKI
ncbi:1-aminocyclopropane-1-carboxylate deaminase/D-cysteine desulfhydrase [Desulforamulus ruminis]|uniref:1-aminocyclopropane-1-carboxylate deaminase n=1 Tax=Desulforamulus ruminis (strain ATCC 23193 / DSM 2154 / NCIMB 8452 / DL) TaxID=696281 RepID=F6DN02_DESRL|nr:D-cysteine desulfhydrase family protein [Desulforamulus ruminis]AEG59460.1 1-aminocyclopropane-1-carboxylate deaminase [Desulforamulus ruminis DSM 2154]